MNAPVKAEAMEVERIEDALDDLLTAAIDADRRPALLPEQGPVSAAVSVGRVIEALDWTQARRQADRLLDRPVPTALRLAVRTLGRRLHEIGGMTLMQDVLYRVADRNPSQKDRRIGIMDHRWSGIGDWMA